MKNRFSLHYAAKWFFTYSEKLIGSLFKIGQGKGMSIFPKRANKFIHLFLVGTIQLWDNCMQRQYYVKMFIIFMYLHENNPQNKSCNLFVIIQVFTKLCSTSLGR
jgi:hypothetical protein